MRFEETFILVEVVVRIAIAGRQIGPNYPPYIIAEISANHNGSIDAALAMIEKAKKIGIDAVKLQSYTPDTITINSRKNDFLIKKGIWKGKYLYDLYKSAHTPWKWHEQLFEKAYEIGITIFSSPFDRTAVDMLEKLGAPAYKIASFELVDLSLIQYVAQTGKPMIISTGMANKVEILEAIDTATQAGCKELAILHCISSYPAYPGDYNLKTISDMISRYGHVVGLSDHAIDNTMSIVSVALGASLIEKHFTLSRNGNSPDDNFSLEPSEFIHLIQKSRIAWQSIGRVNYEVKEGEKENIDLRRSLYAVRDIKMGEKFTKENVRSIRPGYGLSPKYLGRILGMTSPYNLEFGDPIPREFLQQLQIFY